MNHCPSVDWNPSHTLKANATGPSIESTTRKKLAALPPSPYVPDWIVAQREDINEDMLAKLGIDYDPEADDGDDEFDDDESDNG